MCLNGALPTPDKIPAGFLGGFGLPVRPLDICDPAKFQNGDIDVNRRNVRVDRVELVQNLLEPFNPFVHGL